MPCIIFTSRYLNAAPKAQITNFVEYIATRENVDKSLSVNDSRPVTEKQQQTIQQLHEAAPHMKKSLEYADYIENPTMSNASELISETISQNLDLFAEKENFVEYMAKRPGVERHGEHGLFNGEDDPIDLKAVQNEAANHKGRLWTHVVSLRREDAERLGFNNADAWKSVVQDQAELIAKSMRIDRKDLRWYAAFHNESHHPHIHLLAYSANPKKGYLTEQGIEKMRSAFANEIFRQDLEQLYIGKTEVRDELIAAARKRMDRLMDDIKYSFEVSPQLENMVAELSVRLSQHKGRKMYGYLNTDDKKLVDDIVRELAGDERIGALYKEWCGLQDEILGTYKDKLPEHPPLWQQEVFKPIKNAIIDEVANHYDENVFADTPDAEPDEPEWFENEPYELDITPGEQSDEYVIDWSAEYKLAQNYLYGRNDYEQDIEKAQKVFQTEANRGNALAWFEIGRMYRQGLLGDENTGKAEENFEKALDGFLSVEPAADKEWLRSYLNYRIGKMHHMGFGTEKDCSTAAMWYEDAGDNKFAQYSLGSLYFYGDGVEQSYTEALRLYELATMQNNAYALYECGKMYGTGLGCEADSIKSDFYYTKAFNAFEIMEQDCADDKLWYRLGQMCLKGIGTQLDPARAREYFEKSAAAGNEHAKYSLAKMILDDENASPEEINEAVEYMTEAADSGNRFAQYALGKFYLSCEQLELAEKYLLMAAEQGDQHAQYKLGKLYIDENTPLYDTNDAVRWFTESANQGNQFAQYSFGKLLYDNDPAKAVEWLTASAEQGNQYAQYSLGKHYYYENDMETAVSWLIQSAQQGNEYAQKMLDFIINGGHGQANASAITLLYHLSRMIQERFEENNRNLSGQTEKKLLKKIAEKKESLGQRME